MKNRHLKPRLIGFACVVAALLLVGASAQSPLPPSATDPTPAAGRRDATAPTSDPLAESKQSQAAIDALRKELELAQAATAEVRKELGQSQAATAEVRKELGQSQAATAEVRKESEMADIARKAAERSVDIYQWVLVGAVLIAVVALTVLAFLAKRTKATPVLPAVDTELLKVLRTAREHLDQWFSGVARRLAPSPPTKPAPGGECPHEAAMREYQSDLEAIERSKEPGLQAVTPAHVQAAPVGGSSVAAVDRIEVLRDCATVGYRLASAARFDARLIDAALTLLEATAKFAPKREGGAPERAGKEPDVCVRLARAGVALAGSALALDPQRAQRLEKVVDELFQTAIEWLPNSGDIQVHIEKAEWFRQRAERSANPPSRLDLSGRGISEVREAQWKNRSPRSAPGATAVGGAQPALQAALGSMQVLDGDLERRLCERELALRLAALSVPALGEGVLSVLRLDDPAIPNPQGVNVTSPATIQCVASPYEAKTRPADKVQCDLSAAALKPSIDRVLAQLNAALDWSDRQPRAWHMLLLRAALYLQRTPGADHAGHVQLEKGAWDALRAVWDGRDAGAEEKLLATDIAFLRARYLFNLIKDAPPGAALAEESNSLGYSSLIPGKKSRYAEAIAYFARLVELWEKGRPTPSRAFLLQQWRDQLEAGINARGRFTGSRRGADAEMVRQVGDAAFTSFLEAYKRGHAFANDAVLWPDDEGPEAATPVGFAPHSVAVGASTPPGLRLVVVPIKETVPVDGAQPRETVRGLRVIDLSTACRHGGSTEEIRVQREELVRRHADGTVMGETRDRNGQWTSCQEFGIFGLPLRSYTTKAQFREVIELFGGVKVECVQIAELRFNGVSTISDGTPLRVVWSGSGDGSIIVDLPNDRRYDIVPEYPPAVEQAWAPGDIDAVLHDFMQLLVGLASVAGIPDADGVDGPLDRAIDKLREHLVERRGQLPRLERMESGDFRDACEQLALFARGGRYQVSFIQGIWKGLEVHSPAAVGVFHRLLDLLGLEALRSAADQCGIRREAAAAPPPQPKAQTFAQPQADAVGGGKWRPQSGGNSSLAERLADFLNRAGMPLAAINLSTPPTPNQRSSCQGLIRRALGQRPRRIELEMEGNALLRDFD